MRGCREQCYLLGRTLELQQHQGAGALHDVEVKQERLVPANKATFQFLESPVQERNMGPRNLPHHHLYSRPEVRPCNGEVTLSILSPSRQSCAFEAFILLPRSRFKELEQEPKVKCSVSPGWRTWFQSCPCILLHGKWPRGSSLGMTELHQYTSWVIRTGAPIWKIIVTHTWV